MAVIEFVFDCGESKLLGFCGALQSSAEDKLSGTNLKICLWTDCELFKE